jgi:hypothetical protein
MLDIDNKIFSLDIISEKFECNLAVCKGVCCIDGDAGAPLTIEEIDVIEEIFDKIKKYLPEKNLKKIEKVGLFEVDTEGDYVTTCLDSGECVFLTKDEQNIYKCAFEIAFLKDEIDFWKPISCHLYPIRITEYENFTAINYEKRNICKSGRKLGKKNGTKLYEFLKAPLIRKFGEELYNKLDFAARNFKIEK